MGNFENTNLINQSKGEEIFCNICGISEDNNIINKQENLLPQINNNYSPIRKNNDTFIKSNSDKNTPLGSYLTISDYKNSVNKEIINYIENHKLNYQEYYPLPLNTYKSYPIKFKNGDIYHGNWNIDGQMEGYGIYSIKEKNLITEGIWEKGNIIYGRIFFPNKSIYEGYIKNSLPNGKGTIYFVNKEIYKGDFVDGEMTGKGTYIYADKSYYTGKIKNGIFNGEGSMKWINGTEFHGNFLDSTLSGKGKIFNDKMGEKYIGNFDKNYFNGYGVYSYNNGDIYEGNFEHGIKKGKGIFKRNDKVEFEVEWDDDLPNGNGIVTYNKFKLNGLWRNGNIVHKEIIKGNIDIFKELDLNIKPSKICLCPSSLPYLNIIDNDASQFVSGTELSLV